MTVYERTADGQWAAYSAESPLPRKLKTLLKAINGKVSDDVYVKNLSSFGDVAELLRSLVQAGLIADAAQRGSPVPLTPSFIKAIPIEPLRLPVPAQQAEAAELSMADWALQRAVESMANFVLTHLPEGAFNVLPEIEALASLQQLNEMLGGYAQYVAAAGEPARAHLAEIDQLLLAVTGMNVNAGKEQYA
jgi:hypothetical protein